MERLLHVRYDWSIHVFYAGMRSKYLASHLHEPVYFCVFLPVNEAPTIGIFLFAIDA